ncbi:hypothetical protein ABE325_21485 [Bacillus licheniformis]|uniref:hypothetical protein n=1 Tax=Bacillus paralicheniformis TaxID=1648923 RepID=UPI00227D69D4|nr:hypothetical protein [Bacillus paralicheniformis]MCY1628369.1 hypothetical protein [Bacillus paralicheniformis]
MKRHHFSCLILLTCILTLAACSQTSKDSQSSDDQEIESTEENTQQALNKEEKVYRESIKQLTESMGTALDGLVILDDPKGSSEEIEKTKQDTVITIFAIIKTSETLTCPSDRFTEVCNDYDSMVSDFQNIYDKLPEAFDKSKSSARDDITSSLQSLNSSAIELKKDLQEVPSE